MLDEQIKKELEEMGVEQIEKIENKLKNSAKLTNELIESLYSDNTAKRAMKGRGVWNDEYDDRIEMKDRYTGEGKIEITRQKLWVKEGKIRLYFDVTLDGQFKEKNCIKIK